jgi:C-terminal processing protease CtpA/Prc
MQAIGRAVVIGERSARKVPVQSEERLPNGVVLIYPVEQTRTVHLQQKKYLC